MIEVRINRTGVDPEVLIYGQDGEQDEAMLLWPIVREELRRLDRRLKSFSQPSTDAFKSAVNA